MKAKIKVEKEVEVKRLEVMAKVRYWEDSEVNGVSDEEGTEMPCRVNENWCPVIDIEKGLILNWRNGYTASVHFKVSDCGVYRLKDEDGNTIAEVDGYVPKFMSPKEAGYGDYIIMDIDESGMIQDWQFDEQDIAEMMEQEE